MELDRSGIARGVGNLPVNFPLSSLIIVNAFTILLALTEGWNLGVVMFIFWVQSIIIGFFTVIRILDLRLDQIPELEAKLPLPGGGDGVRAEQFLRYGKYLMAGFFAVHYGLFHYGYLSFLAGFGLLQEGNFFHEPDILLTCGFFFVNHLISYLYHRNRHIVSGEYFQELFFKPYLRIIPMHLTIIFGGFASMLFYILGMDGTQFVLLFFLGLKTYVDVRMHVVKHADRIPLQYKATATRIRDEDMQGGSGPGG